MIPTGVFRFTHIFRKETLKHLQLATFFATGLQMIDFLLYILITYNKLRDICDSVPFTKVVVIQCIQSSLTVMNLCYFLSLFLVCLELNYEIPCADNLLNTVITTSAVTLRMFTTAWKQANCGGFSKTPPQPHFPLTSNFLTWGNIWSPDSFSEDITITSTTKKCFRSKKSKPSLPVMIRRRGGHWS